MPESKEKLEQKLREVDARAAELDALKPLKPGDQERLWKKLRLEWNFNSNHLEGNTLTYSQTQLLLLFDQTPAEPHTMRELEEMKAHDVAITLIQHWAKDKNRELSEADLRALNETILVRPFWKEAITPDGQPTRRLIAVGAYKTYPNSVRLPNGEIFHYVAPEEVPREMGILLRWYRTEGVRLHPVVTAAFLHYRLVRIHPFDDGNGRISRLLLNYHLLRNDFPPVVIKSIDKQRYLFALQQADTGDLDAFCIYVAEQILWSLDLSLKAAKGESLEEAGDWEKEVELLKREATAKRKNTKAKKIEQRAQLAAWLQTNFPLLWNAFTRHFKPFDTFFDKAECVAYVQSRNSGINIPVHHEAVNWLEISNGILNGIYLPQITFAYQWEGLIYTDDAYSSSQLNKPELALKLSTNEAILAGEEWPFAAVHRIEDQSLAPIRTLAKHFKDQIRSSLNDFNQYF